MFGMFVGVLLGEAVAVLPGVAVVMLGSVLLAKLAWGGNALQPTKKKIMKDNRMDFFIESLYSRLKRNLVETLVFMNEIFPTEDTAR